MLSFMKINYEIEKTYVLKEKEVKSIINNIINNKFIINNHSLSPTKVNILPTIHFYFETEEGKKDVYKFKLNEGKFILNKVNKSTINGENEFFNIEKIEKIEEIDDYKLDFKNIYSFIYKEKMLINFSDQGFSICFDKVSAIDPVSMCVKGDSYYFCEIEHTDPNFEIKQLVSNYNLDPITQSKFYIGIMENKVSLESIIKKEEGLTNYLFALNDNCYSGFFEQFRIRYLFYSANTELELKIKNPSNNIEKKLINELKEKFIIMDEGSSILEDIYYDYNNILLMNNCSYRIRKTDKNITNVPRAFKKNLFFKVPLEDKGVFSTRIEHMCKFNNYMEEEIISSDCKVNKIVNEFFKCNISNKLLKVLDVKTVRRYFLLYNLNNDIDLVGMLTFDVSDYVMDNKKITMNEVEFELFNDNITQLNFLDNFKFLNSIFYKYEIDNSNKYLYARRCFAENQVKESNK